MDRTQRWLQLAVLCALACAIGGCDDSSIFSIRMRSVAGGLERQLTARLSHEDPDSAATAARLKRVYHVGTWPDSLPFRGKALFRDTLPNDVGGFGRIAHRSSPLGESWMYLERFRGDPDPARSIESRLGAADSAATLLFAWLRHERPDDPRLSDAAEERVRSALRTITIDALRLMTPPEGFDIMNLVQTSDERSWAIRMRRPGTSDWPEQNELTDSWALLVLGMDRPGSHRPDFLSSPDSMRASLARYLAGRTAEGQAPTGRELDGMLERCITEEDIRTSAIEDSLHVELSLPERPHDTNGQWDDSLRVVRWSGYITKGGPDARPPFVCHALWTLPDRARQQRLFGRVALANEDLQQYCDLRAALTSGHAAEWDRMVESLRPGSSGTLREFRFGDERAAGKSVDQSDANGLRSLLLGAIQSGPGK